MVVEIGTTSGCEKRDYGKLDSDMLLSRGTYYSDGWMTSPRAHFLTTEPHKTDPRTAKTRRQAYVLLRI